MADARATPAPTTPPTAAGVAGHDGWDTRRLLGWIQQAFASRAMDSPRLAAEILLAHVLGTERLKLYMDPDRPASQSELATLRGLVQRALRHEPVQYLTGQGWFFGLPFAVDRRVLIPRPCTEVIVETVLQDARGKGAKEPAIADICTGSGCIAAALAKNIKGARAHASDASGDALAVARANAQRLGVGERVEFYEGDLLGALPPSLRGTLGYLVSNPPYIPDHEWDAVPANVKDHEPALALRGGIDGLTFVRPLIEQAAEWLAPGGMLLVEIAACTGGEVLELAYAQPGLAGAQIIKDLEGHERVLMARRAVS
ncbi:MAG: peptide chain release factor N(5)-glutamine methyltransferase [Phycisphaeraceae bacterium]|nr:peptide chain release factor N(5)-glutamine methyltransferase [Phycisphaeraceae bacterium]